MVRKKSTNKESLNRAMVSARPSTQGGFPFKTFWNY